MVIDGVIETGDLLKVKVRTKFIINDDQCTVTSQSSPLYLVTVNSRAPIVFEEIAELVDCEGI